ncbi:DUF2491 family protein [Alteromonas macleodii]|uniref:DUF2491 family protein n=1 Tax=Alteromonas macleodii TaxID=28108 RepID=UPI0031401551|tara:strand:- start:3937 stop:4569 length:633 start_codon:yes stop_codon:yes gene_type:complete
MLSKLFKVGKSRLEQEEQIAPPAPFKDLKIGKRLYFDRDEIKLYQDIMLLDIETCPEDMVIEAQSIIDLGANHYIERFYVDDGYFQVSYEGEAKLENTNELMFVSYDDSTGFGNHQQAEIDAEIKKMQATTYVYRGETFTQSFISEFDEKVTSSDGSVTHVGNMVAVFTRELSNGTIETLIVTMEDCEGITMSIALAVAIPFTRIEPALA